MRTRWGWRNFNVLQPHPSVAVLLTTETRIITVRKDDGVKQFTIPAGAVLLPIWSGGHLPRHAVYGGLYEARRAIRYALAGYKGDLEQGVDGELPMLQSITESFMEINSLLEGWSSLRAAEREEIAERLRESLDALERSRDESKARAADIVDEASDLVDRKGRANPLATAGKVHSAKVCLLERMLAVQDIHVRMMLRLMIIEREISTSVGVIRGVRDQLKKYVRPALRPGGTDASLEQTALRIRKQAKRLHMLQALPFRTGRGLLESLLDIAATAFESGDKPRAARAIASIERIIERMIAQHDLLVVVERLAIMPKNRVSQTRQLEGVKQMLREFRTGHEMLFPRGSCEAWREEFRLGTHDLKDGRVRPAKAHLDSAARALLAA